MAEKNKAADVVKLFGLIAHPEGGFFRETYRSGAQPMVSKGQTYFSDRTQFDVKTSSKDSLTLVRHQSKGTSASSYESMTVAHERFSRRPDGDLRRNCLTSIYWLATTESPMVKLAINMSDIMHYYQGGSPFQYMLYDPATGQLDKVTIGPDIAAGHTLQLAVPGGLWKCGRLIQPNAENAPDYCLIGEAVAPGFDFHDFTMVTPQELSKIPDESIRAELVPYLDEELAELRNIKDLIKATEDFYPE